MAARQRPMHPVLREAALDRRAFLRTIGRGSAGMAVLGTGLLSGCGGDSPERGGAGRRPDEAAASVKPYDPDQPYWQQGNFAAVDEEVTETALEVSGTIPASLSGLYVRNGSNPTSGEAAHWFLGDGMVHGVRFERGQASWYRNRWVQTTLRQRGVDLSGAGVPGRDVNQSNVAIVHHAGKLLTLGEIGWPYELSSADLSTVGPWDYAGRLTTAMTAHPKIDPATGQMHFFGYGFADPLLSYHVADASGQLVSSEPIPIAAPTMIHDFAITEQDVVFWIGPVMFGFVEGGDPSFPFYWDPEGPCRVGVLPLGGPTSAIRWVDIDPCFSFHGLNAHREGDEVVLRLHRLASAFGPEGDLVPSFLTEWRIDTSGEQLRWSEEQLTERDMDLPTIDRRYTGRSNRHGWFATIDQEGPYGFEFAGLSHRDQKTGREQLWEPGAFERAGEAFFVPESEDAGEGEGWLLSYLYDRTTDKSSLGIFDAQDVGHGPLARVRLPVRVPYGFHGLWLAEDALG